jgi:predicted dehydrogenase
LVVGSGSIAKRHIRNLRYLYPGMEITCVSASGRRLEPSEVGASSVCNSIEQAVEAPLAFAIVASPAPLHLANLQKLITANIPVLVEKPLSHDQEELAKYDFSNAINKIGVAYNLRYMPSANKVKRIISDRVLGRLNNVQIECGQYLPDWRPGTDYRQGVSAQKKLGGGALLELSHELDYLLWIFGGIRSVVAKVETTGILDIDVEDNVNALMVSEDDYIIQLHLDFLQRTPKRMLRAVCSKGNLVWDLINNTVSIEGKEGRVELIYSDPYYDKNEMYVEQLKGFIGFTKNQAKFESTIDSASNVMNLIAAIRRSSDMNQWVDVML